MCLFHRRRRKVRGELERVRRERQQSEERLRYDEENTIIPLREIRERNHVGETINELIRRKIERESWGS
jgi:hypothetical protein